MYISPATLVRILTDVTGVLNATSGIHDILVKHPTEAAALIPVLADLGEVPSALEAAEKAAPNLTAAIKTYVGATVRGSRVSSPLGDKKAENLVRSLGGMGPMTPDQETLWMNRANPITDDSRNGGA
jgi:hypothetical protein